MKFKELELETLNARKVAAVVGGALLVGGLAAGKVAIAITLT